MPYCTDADVQLIMQQTSQLLRDSELDMSGQIAAAQAEVDAELAALGYDTPFAAGTVPALVTQMTALKVAVLLTMRVPNLESWHLTYDRQYARKLKAMQGGLLEPTGPDEGKPAGFVQGVVVNPAGTSGSRFTAEKLGRL